MPVGKVYCPDVYNEETEEFEQSPFWFNMYINPKCCQYSQVLRVVSYDEHGAIGPGMVGKIIFRSRAFIYEEVDAVSVKVSDMYNALFVTTGDHSQWFKSQILVL